MVDRWVIAITGAAALGLVVLLGGVLAPSGGADAPAVPTSPLPAVQPTAATRAAESGKAMHATVLSVTQLNEQDEIEDTLDTLKALLALDEKAALQRLAQLHLDEFHSQIAEVLVAYFSKLPSTQALQRLEPLRRNSALYSSTAVALLREHLNGTLPHQATALLLAPANVQVLDIAAYQVGDQLARQDPAGTLAHLQTLSASTIRSQLVEGAMDEWLLRNPQSAAQYMQAHPSDADLDASLLNMLRRYKDNSPIADMMLWAQRIHNPALRLQARQELLEHYQRFAPAQYEAWKRNAG
jgi:hypothetical protein